MPSSPARRCSRASEPTVSGLSLLIHGITFALEFGRLVHALEELTPVRCIVSTNETNATFRFHQIRPSESWNAPDLDRYHLEKIAVLDLDPA